MKTVRLPIYDDGIETRNYLEVDLTFWLSSTAGLRSNQARVVEPEPEPMADWELELLAEAEAAIDVATKRHGDWDKENQRYADGSKAHLCGGPCRETWECLYGLIPSDRFEINRDGVIRIKANKKVIEPTWFDIDQNRFNVMLKINGMEYYLNGPKIAEELWSK